jgi:tol-pal system protein YbgF
MTIRRKVLISTLTLALLSAGPALAQSASDSARLKRLETEMETLSRAIYKGEAPPPSAMGSSNAHTANFELRLNQMESAMRDLTGRVEEQSFTTRQMQERLDRVLSELDRRMVDVETRARAAGMTGSSAYPNPGYSDAGEPAMPSSSQSTPSWVGGTAPQPLDAGDLPPMPSTTSTAIGNGGMAGPSGLNTHNMGGPSMDAPATDVPTGQLGVLANDPVTGAPSLPLASDSPAAFYEQAFALLRARDYAAAGTAFEDFLERYPDHDLSPNAKYWLGESWYVRNNFERAARIFAEAYQQNTKGPKAPDNLLKLALSLNGMGKKEEACLSLAQLKKEFGAITSPVLARADQEATKIGCK